LSVPCRLGCDAETENRRTNLVNRFKKPKGIRRYYIGTEKPKFETSRAKEG
jgi:hypothetical protein